jgi:glutathione synthase/RimK-type ligase-like ATP-grasp enzyme
MIITRFSQLLQEYHHLGEADVFAGQVPPSHLKSALLVDLAARGIVLIPSATAQIVNASKTSQAFLLRPWMVPLTRVIGRRKELFDALAEYERHGIREVITKTDRQHCGQGIFHWQDVAMAYNCLAMRAEAYPFVLQPFVKAFTDVRVIVVGDFHEAYSRRNPHGFRMNLAAGGVSRPFRLTPEQHRVCLDAMHRARMPFAHIDLMITPEEKIYLSEIRLNGGVHGATIARRELDALKHAHLMDLARQAAGSHLEP